MSLCLDQALEDGKDVFEPPLSRQEKPFDASRRYTCVPRQRVLDICIGKQSQHTWSYGSYRVQFGLPSFVLYLIVQGRACSDLCRTECYIDPHKMDGYHWDEESPSKWCSTFRKLSVGWIWPFGCFRERENVEWKLVIQFKSFFPKKSMEFLVLTRTNEFLWSCTQDG